MLQTHPVIALELAALERWCNGDPSGFLELSADDVVYFDPYLPQRLDGLEKLTEYYEGIRGKIFAPRHEMIEPHVTEIGDAAVLTFRFNSYSGSEGKEMRWNCTEVYRRQNEGWRIVQSHWSFTAPIK
ncbi:YybH family protein [Agrobacterium sp. NPDC090283]|uniref:YybH family protein n=1 Tax=Agrobacterium sp. NPDC090283 TaxID=3363920 RepID=UPI00383A6296